MTAKTEEVPLLRLPDLVGRERELDLLRQAFAAPAPALAPAPAKAPAPATAPAPAPAPAALVLVEGEAGIGKTRLITEFLATGGSRGRVLVAICPPFRKPHTLGPIVDAIRTATDRIAQLKLSQLAGALRSLFPEWADELPPAPEEADDPTAVRHRLFRALTELLDQLGVAALVVEDAHWADEATLEFLLLLCTQRNPRTSVVLTYRPEETTSMLRRLSSRQPPGMTLTRITLGPLDQQNTAKLMSSMLACEPISDEFALFMHQHTDGVPLAVEESVRLMRDREDVARRDGVWVRRDVAAIEVPPTIRDAVTERVANLGDDARAVLAAAAVLAEPAREAVLAEVANITARRARYGIAEGLDEGLLTEDATGLIAFRHVLACRAVHESVRTARRIELHRRAGEALRRAVPVSPTQVARHFREARETTSWCRYAEQAIDAALAAGDEMTASTLVCELVTGAQPDAGTALRLMTKLRVGSLTQPGDLKAIATALRGVVADPALDPATVAELRTQIGRVLGLVEENDAARAELLLAIPHLGHRPAEAVRAMIILGLPRDLVCPATEHLRWLRRAADRIAELPDEPHLVLLVVALLLLGEQEGWAAGARFPEEPATVADRPIVTQNLLNLGDMAVRWGRYDQAQRYLGKALSLAEKYRHPRMREIVVVTQAYLAWLTGRWSGLAERATRLADTSSMTVPSMEALMVAGLVNAVRGEPDLAAKMLAKAQAETFRCCIYEIGVEAAAGLARLHLAQGRPGDSLTVTDLPMRVVADKGIWFWAADLLPARIDALAAFGRIAEAASLVDRCAGWMDGRDIPLGGAGLLASRAGLAQARGEHAEAARLFAAAQAAYGQLPRPYFALLCTERAGTSLLASGRRDDGLAALSRAARGLAELGASSDQARVQRNLREHGAPAGRPGRRGYGDQLSPRETDVATLVVDGLTNRDIAERLFLSPRTVARHVDSAMRKLGVTSRTALAVRVVQQEQER